MSCSCNTIPVTSPSGECLPTLPDPCSSTPESCNCVTDTACLDSSASEGATVPAWVLDSGCYSENVTLLGRAGSKLARLAGNGFIRITNGKASVVSSVPIQIRTLWHRWFKVTSKKMPVLGEPLGFPYQVIASASGDLHGIRGLDDVDSITVWNGTTKEFSQVPAVELSKDQKGLLPVVAELELAGYAPIPEGGTGLEERPLSSLYGEGLVVLSNRTTVSDPPGCGGCEEGLGVASVAATIASPPEGTHVLKCIEGVIQWVEE